MDGDDGDKDNDMMEIINSFVMHIIIYSLIKSKISQGRRRERQYKLPCERND